MFGVCCKRAFIYIHMRFMFPILLLLLETSVLFLCVCVCFQSNQYRLSYVTYLVMSFLVRVGWLVVALSNNFIWFYWFRNITIKNNPKIADEEKKLENFCHPWEKSEFFIHPRILFILYYSSYYYLVCFCNVSLTGVVDIFFFLVFIISIVLAFFCAFFST